MVIYFGEQSSYTTTYLVESDDKRSRRNYTENLIYTFEIGLPRKTKAAAFPTFQGSLLLV